MKTFLDHMKEGLAEKIITDEVLSEAVDHEGTFWSHIRLAMKAHENGNYAEHDERVSQALSAAKSYHKKTGKPLRIGHGLNGLESKHVEHK